ncbi:MAG: glycosyltransferase, partial [Pseudomonadota bacterium]
MKVQTNNARVAVVLCTYNGAAYLDAQLDSLAASSRPIDLLIVSDDGSTDTSLAIIDRHLSDWGRRVSVYPNRTNVGFAQNFFSALRRVPDDVDWIFLCDQDDVWHRDKMACALRRGASVDPARAYLYTCRQRLVDAAGKFVRLSPQFDRPGFRSALVQNVATGCAHPVEIGR